MSRGKTARSRSIVKRSRGKLAVSWISFIVTGHVKGTEQPEINKASQMRRGDFAGGFDEQGITTIGAWRSQCGIVPMGDARAI